MKSIEILLEKIQSKKWGRVNIEIKSKLGLFEDKTYLNLSPDDIVEKGLLLGSFSLIVDEDNQIVFEGSYMAPMASIISRNSYDYTVSPPSSECIFIIIVKHAY